MKILLITDNHNPDGGGAEKYFFTLKSELQKQSDLKVTSLGFGPEAKTGEDYIVLQETPNTLMRLCWRLFFNHEKYAELRDAIATSNPDVIHLHNVKKYTVSLLKAVQGYKIIQTVHDYGAICPTGWNLHKDLTPCPTGLRWRCLWQHKRDMNSVIYAGLLFAFFRMKILLKKVSTKFIAPSPLLADYLKKNNFNEAIYLPPFRLQNSSINFQKMQPNHFLYVGQLGKHKGVDMLIDEFALACQTNKNLRLKIAGKGTEEERLRQKIKTLALENNICFTGWTTPDALYEECTALIFPSIGLEAFGLVLTEAMNYGRPIIGSNRGPTAWLVADGKTGLLYDPLKPGELAKKILQLADDKDSAEKYGRAAFEKLQTFMNNQQIIEEMVKIYREWP
jgi:glycosyltransferase involved in cell wall biosynthesis